MCLRRSILGILFRPVYSEIVIGEYLAEEKFVAIWGFYTELLIAKLVQKELNCMPLSFAKA
jgi:hypothetical protein